MMCFLEIWSWPCNHHTYGDFEDCGFCEAPREIHKVGEGKCPGCLAVEKWLSEIEEPADAAASGSGSTENGE